MDSLIKTDNDDRYINRDSSPSRCAYHCDAKETATAHKHWISLEILVWSLVAILLAESFSHDFSNNKRHLLGVKELVWNDEDRPKPSGGELRLAF
jgi:hypothetical protein